MVNQVIENVKVLESTDQNVYTEVLSIKIMHVRIPGDNSSTIADFLDRMWLNMI